MWLSTYPRIIQLLRGYTSFTAATDIRDKVFGILGFDEKLRDFLVNHYQDRYQLLTDLMVYLERRQLNSHSAIVCSSILQKALFASSSNTYIIGQINTLQGKRGYFSYGYPSFCH